MATSSDVKQGEPRYSNFAKYQSLSCSSEEGSSSSVVQLPTMSVKGPLLGSNELIKCLPRKEAVIQICTWNMGSLPFPSDNQLKRIFKHDGIDIHIIAIQESWPSPDESELLFQTSLGPGFVLFHSVTFGTLHLCIFLRRELVWYTCEPVDVSHTVRSGRLFKTKGAVGIGFGLFGTNILIINAHLSAGEESSREIQRMEELNRILVAHEINKNRYDTVYLAGDLNFRISGLGREKIVEELKNNNLQNILMEDQLNKLLINSSLPDTSSLKGFSEAAAITFRPTYKYDIGTDNFDSSAKKRAPAYTDRIIYKCFSEKSGFPVPSQCLKYEAVTELKVSDHRPVIAMFSIKLKPGFDTLPITGGRFKRDVYAKAMQKRAKFLLDKRISKLASTACNLS
ncbi:inositol polyphosphate 5-phosphatase E-like [Folsomia candida]|uniref:inositol polyphosphate 5-phosphatase E-like n=1 Tax=Folsomia candida TaxID=158441 RepID=UPI00160545F8|nr:inositol polyphosphate 5-phosphatase E-like [Folsomia candida]